MRTFYQRILVPPNVRIFLLKKNVAVSSTLNRSGGYLGSFLTLADMLRRWEPQAAKGLLGSVEVGECPSCSSDALVNWLTSGQLLRERGIKSSNNGTPNPALVAVFSLRTRNYYENPPPKLDLDLHR
jgi:hypothetical protein